MSFQKVSPIVKLIDDSQAIRMTLSSLFANGLEKRSDEDNDCSNGITIADFTAFLVVGLFSR